MEWGKASWDFPEEVRCRDSSLPPSDSFLFHSLAFFSAEAFSEGMWEPQALCRCGILDSSRV